MKHTYLAISAMALAFVACDDNEQPEFSDSDAFVAFASSTSNVEEGEEVEIPVSLASVAGLSKSAYIEIISNDSYTAVEGTDFEIVGSKTLKFDAENRTAYITIKSIANGVYTGDVKIGLALKSDEINVGAQNQCVVTIADAEHPLQPILGSYSASADSYFSSRGHFDWTITLSKDESDVSKVYIDNLDPYFASAGYTGHIYGTVETDDNGDLTLIKVPAQQGYGYKYNGTEAVLAAFSTADPDDANAKELTASENMEIEIKDSGKTLVVKNSYGIYASGWWNLMYGDLTLTKK